MVVVLHWGAPGGSSGSLEVHPGYVNRIVGGRSSDSYGVAGFIGMRDGVRGALWESPGFSFG